MSSIPLGADQNGSGLEEELRPSRWDDYIGQAQTKQNLSILIRAAKERKQSPEHVLFYGPPGLGKTTLAHLIARELGSGITATSGPVVERVGDLASILTNLTAGDVLFIDEMHRLNKAVEEVLYPALEVGMLDIIIGKGPSARTIQLELPPFTLVAATTRIALLSSPLRSRFGGGVFKLDFYSESELEEILARSARILGIDASRDTLREIAHRSRYTPRTANYFLKRCRDFAQINREQLSVDVVRKTFALLGVDDVGLTEADRSLLKTIAQKFGGGPVGLTTLAAALSDDPATVEDVYEPYLMQLGFLERSSRGRILTDRAVSHLNLGMLERRFF